MASQQTIKVNASRFASIKSKGELATLLRIPMYKLELLSINPYYKEFPIRKKNGSNRWIEDPNTKLKSIQSKLNDFLQSIYYKHRPPSVYGFCLSTSNEEERNIVSNAKRHIGKAYLLNIDLKDFFHTILSPHVSRSLEELFPNFELELIELITNLCTFKDRLPMGAVTSPILSNICSIGFDHQLLEYCKYAGITFTRYADDLSFSSNQEIVKIDIESIENIIHHAEYVINPDKVKYFSPLEEKIVTGIIVGKNDIHIPGGYLSRLDKELDRFEHVKCFEYKFQSGMSGKKLKLFEQELRGKINFANMVMPDNEEVIKLYDRFETILTSPEEFESIDWLEIPYQF